METSPSLADRAYQELSKRIVYGEYLPGALLSENALSGDLKMSRTPIRDALRRLTSDGFVVTLKNRGIFVKDLSYKELFDISVLNQWMQIHAAELAMKGEITFDTKRLKSHLDLQLNAELAGDYPEYIRQSILFGRCIIEATSNQTMLEVFDTYRNQTLRMAIVNWKLYPKEKHYSANELNSQIYDVISTGNYDKLKPIFEKYATKSKERFTRDGRL